MRRLRPTSSPLRKKRAAASSPASPASPSPSPSPSPSRSAAAGAPPAAASLVPAAQVVVKLGGSALTDKTRPHTLHDARVAAGLDVIARAHAGGVLQIVVHGAGSFGHFEAAAHGVQGGGASALGMCETHAAVTRLNAVVVRGLIERGVPAVGVAPLLVPAKTRVQFVAALLDRGCVPVLHGDVCYKGDGRTAVLSGDALVAQLVGGFGGVTRAVFVSNVPGVLRVPPAAGGGGGDGQVVRTVRVGRDGLVRMECDVRTAEGTDVTGGMRAKVMAAAKCVAAGAGRVTAFVVGVGTEEMERAVTGVQLERWREMGCTRFVYCDDDGGEGGRGGGGSGSGSGGGGLFSE